MNKIFLALAIVAIVVEGCHNDEQQATTSMQDTAIAPPAADSLETYIYEGRTETLWGDTATITLTLHTKLGSGSGSYEKLTDYDNAKPYEGKKVEDINDKGTFTTERSADFGDVYVLKGMQPVEFYYQAVDNKLNELNHDRKSLTGFVLTQTEQPAVQRTATGGDKDEHDCLTSAGYTWSTVKNDCVRTFEVADLKLNPKEPKGSYNTAAMVIFNKDQSQAEVFLPEKVILLDRISSQKGKMTWKNDKFELLQGGGFALLEDKKIIYHSE